MGFQSVTPQSAAWTAAFNAGYLNIQRAQNLCTLYSRKFAGKKGRKHVHQADVLRAAVVFAHAAMEDVLRRLLAEKLPLAGEKVLNSVSLIGLNASGHPEKFLLGRLVQHRGKTVAELISASVNDYLAHRSYNNTADIAEAVKSLGVEWEPLRKYEKSLSNMTARRHRIVHSADQVETPGKGKQFAESVRLATVQKWINDTGMFLSDVISAVREAEKRPLVLTAPQEET